MLPPAVFAGQKKTAARAVENIVIPNRYMLRIGLTGLACAGRLPREHDGLPVIKMTVTKQKPLKNSGGTSVTADVPPKRII